MVMLNDGALESLRNPFESAVIMEYELKPYDVTVVPVGKFRTNTSDYLRFNPHRRIITDSEKETVPIAVSVYKIIKAMVFPPRQSVLEKIFENIGKEIDTKDFNDERLLRINLKLSGINLVSVREFRRYTRDYLDFNFSGDYKNPRAYTGIINCGMRQHPFISAFLLPPNIGYKLLRSPIKT